MRRVARSGRIGCGVFLICAPSPHTKIQQTKMLVMGHRFGGLFLFGLV